MAQCTHPVSASTHGDWVHAQFTIHCLLQSAWPSPSFYAGNLPQTSHTVPALGHCGHSERQPEQQSSHPEGEGATVDCDTKYSYGLLTNVVRIVLIKLLYHVKRVQFACIRGYARVLAQNSTD